MQEKLAQVVRSLIDDPFEIPMTPPHVEDDKLASAAKSEPAVASASTSAGAVAPKTVAGLSAPKPTASHDQTDGEPPAQRVKLEPSIESS